MKTIVNRRVNLTEYFSNKRFLFCIILTSDRFFNIKNEFLRVFLHK